MHLLLIVASAAIPVLFFHGHHNTVNMTEIRKIARTIKKDLAMRRESQIIPDPYGGSSGDE